MVTKMNIPLFKIYFDEKDLKSVNKIIQSGMYWAIGPEINKFEEEINRYIGKKYCVLFNSGTSALHAILQAYNVKNQDEVIVPSFTFIATANAPLFVRAKPIFADIEPTTLGLDPESVLEKITSKTKALIPVHYGGCPADIKNLKEIAQDHKLLLIEDAAESFGSKLEDQMIGTFGDSSMLSFCQNKIITTGEGGAIITDSKDIFEKLLLFRSHGRLEDKNYFTSPISGDYVSLGYNLRMSNINASLGLSQLDKVEEIISMRIKKAKYYINQLKRISEITLPYIPQNARHVFQLFSIQVKHHQRSDLIKFLTSKGIMSKVYFSPIHLTYFYKEVLKYKVSLPVTESISKETLSLPIYPAMNEKELEYVSSAMMDFFNS